MIVCSKYSGWIAPFSPNSRGEKLKGKNMKRLLFLGLVLISFSWHIPAESAENISQFQTDLDKTYVEYRNSLLFSNQNDRLNTLKSLRQVRQNWSEVIRKYSEHPPCEYLGDKNWKPSLNKVGGIIDNGLRQAEGGDMLEAHETLENIRAVLSELRRRNGIIAFSDHVDQLPQRDGAYSVKEIYSRSNGPVQT